MRPANPTSSTYHSSYVLIIMQLCLFTVAIMAVSGFVMFYATPPTSSSREANTFDSAHVATHKAAACVSNRMSSPVGGTPFSPSYNWQTTYEVLADATKCACDMYNQRSTGDEWWDTCTDCTFVSFRLETLR